MVSVFTTLYFSYHSISTTVLRSFRTLSPLSILELIMFIRAGSSQTNHSCLIRRLLIGLIECLVFWISFWVQSDCWSHHSSSSTGLFSGIEIDDHYQNSDSAGHLCCLFVAAFWFGWIVSIPFASNCLDYPLWFDSCFHGSHCSNSVSGVIVFSNSSTMSHSCSCLRGKTHGVIEQTIQAFISVQLYSSSFSHHLKMISWRESFFLFPVLKWVVTTFASQPRLKTCCQASPKLILILVSCSSQTETVWLTFREFTGCCSDLLVISTFVLSVVRSFLPTFSIVTTFVFVGPQPSIALSRSMHSSILILCVSLCELQSLSSSLILLEQDSMQEVLSCSSALVATLLLISKGMQWYATCISKIESQKRNISRWRVLISSNLRLVLKVWRSFLTTHKW